MASRGEEAAPRPKRMKPPPFIPKSQAEAHRLHIESLMKNPDRPARIPEPRKERGPRDAPEFVRWVPGSSAGAGSGEFHVYRGLRAKENARQEHIHKSAEREEKEEEFQEQRRVHQEAAAAKTAKKRGKRQRKKDAKKMRVAESTAKDSIEESCLPAPRISSSESEESDKEDDAVEPSFVMGGR